MSVEELVNKTRAAIPETFEYDKESDGYYDTPITHILRENADKLEELAAENEQMRTVRRWSLDEADGTLYVCRGEHEKSEPCGWEPFIPLSQSEAALAEKDKEIAALRDALKQTVEIVRQHVPNIPPDGPTSTEHQSAYEAVGFALQDLERYVISRNDGGKNG